MKILLSGRGNEYKITKSECLLFFNSNLVDKKIVDDEFQYISKSFKDKKIVPNFLIERNQDSEDIKTLLNGLKLVGDYLYKTILKPNNLTQPIPRLQFISTLKWLF